MVVLFAPLLLLVDALAHNQALQQFFDLAVPAGGRVFPFLLLFFVILLLLLLHAAVPDGARLPFEVFYLRTRKVFILGLLLLLVHVALFVNKNFLMFFFGLLPGQLFQYLFWTRVLVG